MYRVVYRLLRLASFRSRFWYWCHQGGDVVEWVRLTVTSALLRYWVSRACLVPFWFATRRVFWRNRVDSLLLWYRRSMSPFVLRSSLVLTKFGVDTSSLPLARCLVPEKETGVGQVVKMCNHDFSPFHFSLPGNSGKRRIWVNVSLLASEVVPPVVSPWYVLQQWSRYYNM